MTNGWFEKYKICEEYQKEYGNLLIPKKTIINNTNIGMWLCDQRKYKKKREINRRKDNVVK